MQTSLSSSGGDISNLSRVPGSGLGSALKPAYAERCERSNQTKPTCTWTCGTGIRILAQITRLHTACSSAHVGYTFVQARAQGCPMGGFFRCTLRHQGMRGCRVLKRYSNVCNPRTVAVQSSDGSDRRRTSRPVASLACAVSHGTFQRRSIPMSKNVTWL